MPGMDGKGPTGTGPIGRSQGNCRQNNGNTEDTTDQTQQPIGRGQGQGLRGQGMGRGMGNRGPCGRGGRGGGGGRGGNR